MKVLITGATGFIGTHLTKQLVAEGHEITALLRTESKRKLLPLEVNIIKGDMSIFKDKSLELPEFDAVIHLAGAIFAKNKQGYLDGNFGITKDLIDCLDRQNFTIKRFLYASSLAAAGPSSSGVYMKESDKAQPIDPYGEAKLITEKYLLKLKNFPITCFRPAIVLGPGDENSLTLFQMAQKRIGMSVDGKPQKLSFIDVDDLNDALVKMMMDDSKEHKVYFVAHPNQTTNVALFEALGDVLNRKVIMLPIPKVGLFAAMKISTVISNLVGIKNQLDKKQYDQLINNFECSSEQLQRDLDWKPKYNLSASIKKAYDGYVALGML